DLASRAVAALERDAAHRGAVVVAPVSVGRREAVRDDALVRVHGRTEERLEARGMLEDAGDEAAGERAEPVRPALVRERVVAGSLLERDVEMEAGAALIAERPAHEGGEEPLASGDLLDGGLEH